MAEHIMANFQTAAINNFNRGNFRFVFMGTPVSIVPLSGIVGVYLVLLVTGSVCAIHTNGNHAEIRVL